MKKIMVSVVAVLSVILMGCKSTSNVSSSKEITKTIPNNGVSVAGMETQIVDWDGRTKLSPLSRHFFSKITN